MQCGSLHHEETRWRVHQHLSFLERNSTARLIVLPICASIACSHCCLQT
jgi:hypothetical protein